MQTTKLREFTYIYYLYKTNSLSFQVFHRVDERQSSIDKDLITNIKKVSEIYLHTINESNKILHGDSSVHSVIGSTNIPLGVADNIFDDFQTIEKLFQDLKENLSERSPSYTVGRRYIYNLRYHFLFERLSTSGEHGYTIRTLQKCSDEENNITGTYNLVDNKIFACEDKSTGSTVLAYSRNCTSSVKPKSDLVSYCGGVALYEGINETLLSIYNESSTYEEKIKWIFGNTTEYPNILRMREYQQCLILLRESIAAWDNTLIKLYQYYDEYWNATTWTKKLHIALNIEDVKNNISGTVLNFTLFDDCNWFYHDMEYFNKDKALKEYQDYSSLARGSITEVKNTEHIQDSITKSLHDITQRLSTLLDPYISYLNGTITKTFLHQYTNSEVYQSVYADLKLKHSSYESTVLSFSTKWVEIENYLRRSFKSVFNMTVPVMTYDTVSQFRFVTELYSVSKSTNVSNSFVPELLALLRSDVEMSLIGLLENTLGTYSGTVVNKIGECNKALYDLDIAMNLALDDLDVFSSGSTMNEEFFM